MKEYIKKLTEKIKLRLLKPKKISLTLARQHKTKNKMIALHLQEVYLKTSSEKLRYHPKR